MQDEARAETVDTIVTCVEKYTGNYEVRHTLSFLPSVCLQSIVLYV